MRGLILLLLFSLALGMNFWAGLKYPDVAPSIVGLLSTGIYLLALFSLRNKTILFLSTISSCLTGILFAMESSLIEIAFLDFLGAIRYPLYVFFIMPLFGLNKVFSLPLHSFAFLCTGIYMVLFLFCLVRVPKSLIAR